MRRIIYLSSILLLLILGLWWFGRSLAPPRTTLADGTTLTIQAVHIGPYESLEPPPDLLPIRILQKLPPALQRMLKPFAPGNRSAGRSYLTDTDQRHALHLWFNLRAQGKPVDPDPFEQKLFLADEHGWLYPSCGWADRGSGRFNVPEQICHSFAVLPRWQRTMDLVMASQQTNGLTCQLRLANPNFMASPATNWPVADLPQEIRQDGILFRLTSLTPRRNEYSYRHFQGTGLRSPPEWYVTLESEDPDGTTNAWQVIRRSFYDNYLNHSQGGLPPRQSSDDGLDAWQWQIQLTVAADHRSRHASNMFWNLPSTPVPDKGSRFELSETNLMWADLDVHCSGLIGPGITTFTNGRVQKMVAPLTDSRGKSSSSSSQGVGSNQVHTRKLTRSQPHLIFHVRGAYTNYYYSCRAVDQTSGDSLWLNHYRSRINKPNFQRIYNWNDLLEWDCQELKKDREYQFILGIHPHRTLNFFVAAPFSQPEE